jgi:epoxyqueuosine reductase
MARLAGGAAIESGMDWVALRDEVLARALGDGFAAAGVAGVRPFKTARRRALDAIDAGHLDGMPWFNRDRVDAAADLRRRHPWARAMVSLAWAYPPAPAPAPTPAPGPARGRMAAYATLPTEAGVVDYHDLLEERCLGLLRWLKTRVPDVRAKSFVDHGWAMDKPIAERSGIGFVGKNTTLLTQAAGSYVVLSEVLVSLPLPPTPVSRRSCGGCTACLPSCPTGALLAPGVMDARRCISYLTIEHRGSIPEDLRPLMGTWIFGCDLCMEACPVNQRRAPAAAADPGPSTEQGPVPFPGLVEALELTDEEFRRRFHGTAVWRTGRAGLARNAAIALGNAGDREAIPALARAAAGDPDEVVRESATWAVERLA